MPTLANSNMVLHGRPYRRGEVVPQEVLDSIEGGRRDAMYRQKMFKDVSQVEADEIAARLARTDPIPTGEAGLCPDCGAGPFVRVAQHQAQMHPEKADKESARGNVEISA
jgi:hypothetical protein